MEWNGKGTERHNLQTGSGYRFQSSYTERNTLVGEINYLIQKRFMFMFIFSC